jgi:DNA helicase-2/ATP-dependent DNA helicase PcrA
MATGTAEGVDEERRLFYVALTRARSHLHIYAPLRYHHGDPAGWTDKHSYAQRTRFLPPELDGLMEMRAVRSRVDLPMPTASLPVSKAVDVGLSGLW